MPEPRAVSRALGRQISLHTGLYGLSAVITFALGIVNIAVLTRFLSLEEFGELALLLLLATLVTVVANLATLQGSFLWVFGSTGEEGGDVAEGGTVAKDKRVALTTGLVLTALVAGLLVAFLVLLHEPISDVLGGGVDHADAVNLAIYSGGLGALWRFAVNVMRYERRPGAFVVLSALRPLAVLGIAIPLVASGEGVAGALLGTAAGTGAATLVALVATRRSYALRFDWSAASPILRRGAFLIPVTVSFWVIQNVDLYVVSLYTTEADVARYRVASRVGAGVSYFASAFLMAWMPLTRTVLHAAVDREHGSLQVTAKIVTYFAAACLWIVLALVVLADVLIRIAPATYESAAPLIPLIGLGFALYGSFVVLYRGVRIRAKRTAYAMVATGAALVFVGMALVLTPEFEAYGAAAAPIVAFALAIAVLLALAQRGTDPIPFERRLLTRAAVIAAGCLATNLLLAPLLGEWRIAVDGAVLIAFPALLVGTGVVQGRMLRELAADLLSWRRPDVGLRHLDRAETATGALDRDTLGWLAVGRLTPAEAAIGHETSEASMLRSFVRTLRHATGSTGDTAADEEIGRYLLSPAGVADRDEQLQLLLEQGADPGDLLRLEAVLHRLTRDEHRAPASTRSRPLHGSVEPLL